MMRKLLLILAIFCSMSASAQVINLTANNVTVHFGDEIPPLTYLASNYSWATAIFSGEAKATTTYTKGAAIGTYPITLATDPSNPIVPQSGFSVSYFPGTLTVIAATGKGARTNNTIINSPGIQSYTVSNGTCSPLVANSVAAATANQTNLNCYNLTGRPGGSYTNAPKMFYLPTGVYYLNDLTQFRGCCYMITGDGPSKSIFKLAPKSPGYDNPSVRKQFIYFSGNATNQGFYEFARNFGVEIGPGNPGAEAFTYIANNADSARNINVWIDDTIAYTTCSMFNAFPGPTMFQDLGCYGGRYGVQNNQQTEYTPTFEYLTVQNQYISGVLTGSIPTVIKGLFSSQELAGVPAWTNSIGNAVLYDGELINGGGVSTALISTNPAGSFTVKNAVCTGYQYCLNDANGSSLLGTPIAFHYSGTAACLFNCGYPAYLGLPATDTPIPTDPPAISWGKLPYDMAAWAAYLATCPSSTVYAEVISNYPANVPDNTNVASWTGTYKNAGAVTIPVPSCINHIVGNNMRAIPTAGSRIYWQVTTASATPLVIDTFSQASTFSHTGSRTLVLKDLSTEYYSTPGAGDLYLDSVQLGGTTSPTGLVARSTGPESGITTFSSGQHIWWRQMDDESDGGNAGAASGVTNVALNLVGSDEILTITLNAGTQDPYMYVGLETRFGSTAPLTVNTWLNNSAAVITNIAGNVITLKWYGTHANQPPTAETGGGMFSMYNKVACTGCTLWALNYKSEKPNTDLFMKNGNGEIWGGFKYTVGRWGTPTTPVYKIVDSNFNFVAGYFASAPQNYNWLTETRNGITLSYPNPGGGGAVLQNSKFFYSLPPAGSTWSGSIFLAPGGTYQ